MKKLYFLSILAFLFISCSKEAEKEPIKADLSGKWEYISMNVTINSPDNETGEEFFFVLPGEWETKTGITPIVTYLNKDSTFKTEFIAVADSSMQGGSGKWSIEGDSLVFTERNNRVAYEFSLKDTLLTIKGKTDFDQDGRKDDDYKGVQMRK
jgi:hypothetical protein